MIKKITCFITFLLITITIFGNENSERILEKNEIYNKEKLSYVVKEEFDPLYPLNVKKFTFFQGEKEITFKEFLSITNDPFLLKIQNRIRNIKINGFTTAGVFGGLMVGFAIPSIIFIVKQTNYNPVDVSYTFSGVAMIILTGVSFMGLLIDLFVTFIALYRNQFSEYPIRKAVENYNYNLQKKLGLLPDLSYLDKKITIKLTKKI